MWILQNFPNRSNSKMMSATLSCLFQGKNKFLIWREMCAYVAPYWLAHWQCNSRNSFSIWTSAACVLQLKKAEVMTTHGNLKTWMWVVGNVFCFIEITFTILMTLKDYSELMLHVYDGTEMSHIWNIYIWKCDWNALKGLFLKCMMKWIFFPFSDAWISFFFLFFFFVLIQTFSTVLRETL